MVTVLEGCPPLPQEGLETIAADAKEHAIVHGILMRTEDDPNSSERVQYAPFTLFPSVVPKGLLSQVRAIQPDFSRLMHKIAHDKDFLYHCFKNVLAVDDFTKNLWNIYCTVQEEGLAQPVSFGLFRNDYMMDMKNKDNIQMKQIEFNTIASSFGGLVSQLTNVHRFSLTEAKKKYDSSQLPDNNCSQGFVNGMIKAWQVYNNESAVILFLVSKGERNRFDQRLLDTKLFKTNPRAKVIFRTFTDLAERSSLTDDKLLFIDGLEVAVVYFRAGYAPNDYNGEKDWDIRLRIERSKALKCPPVHYQLAGAKKVQMELCCPGAVEKYISDQQFADNIRATFVEQLSLDLGSDGDAAVQKALSNPQKYVLKPNREGGGNNFYDDEIRDVLSKIKDSPERAGYILMERIHPWPQKNCLLKVDQDITVRDVISEIGIYAVYLGSVDDEIENNVTGYLVRTKTVGTNEGGISKGFSCLDTPFLVD